MGGETDRLTSDVSRQKEVFSNKILKCIMGFLEASVEEIRNLVRENKTYKQIREVHTEAFPEVRRGFFRTEPSIVLRKAWN